MWMIIPRLSFSYNSKFHQNSALAKIGGAVAAKTLSKVIIGSGCSFYDNRAYQHAWSSPGSRRNKQNYF